MTEPAPRRRRPQDDDKWVVVAHILRPHGLRGTMRLKAITRTPEDFLEFAPDRFFLRRQGRVGPEEYHLLEAKIVKDVIHATFEEILDRTAAEQYTNCDFVIPEEERWELPEGEFFVDDLRGLDVVDAASGERLGVVSDAREGAAHDYLILDLNAAKGKETYLPIHPEFVARVAIADGRVEVKIPEGLVD
ncbi:MAG: ribosome maturation factor RimM [Sumerlaeia bacterium]